MSLCEVLGQLHVLHVELWIQGDALVLVLRALLLSLVFVHVYGDGEAFPESWVADACHFVVVVRVVVVCERLVNLFSYCGLMCAGLSS